MQYSLSGQLFTFALVPFPLSWSIKSSLTPVTDITFPMLATNMQGQRWSCRKSSITSVTLKLHPILVKQQMSVQSFDSRKRLLAPSTLLSFCVSANMMMHLSPRHSTIHTEMTLNFWFPMNQGNMWTQVLCSIETGTTLVTHITSRVWMLAL